MEVIRGIQKQVFVRPEYVEMGPPPGMDGGPGGPGGPDGTPGFEMENSKPVSAALEIKNGKVVNHNEALTGEISDTEARLVKMKVNSSDMGGIFVSGEGSDYTVEHANILISGEGGGLGGKLSGAAVEDHAKLTLKDCRINMDGILRCATSAGGDSVLKVYDSMLISHGAPWNVDELEASVVMGPGMGKPPVYLEIEGNMRTHCTVMNSESYFYNTTVIADSWAALSTDAAGDRVYLEANDCNVITTRSGYGTYADGGCHCVLNRCNLDVQNMAAIVAGEASVKFTDCNAKCGSYIVLNHIVAPGPFGGRDEVFTEVSKIDIIGGKYQCADAGVIAKSVSTEILFDGADVTSLSGVLVKSRVNDDPCAPDPAGRDVYGVHVTLKNMNTENSILHEDPNRKMVVNMEKSTLKGAITGGAMLSMDADSRWTATADSNVILNGDVNAEQIDAPAGVTITAVGGEDKTVTLPSGGVLNVKAA